MFFCILSAFYFGSVCQILASNKNFHLSLKEKNHTLQNRYCFWFTFKLFCFLWTECIFVFVRKEKKFSHSFRLRWTTKSRDETIYRDYLQLAHTHTHTHTHKKKARPGFCCTHPLHPFLGFCHWSGETDAQISLIYCEDLFGLLFPFLYPWFSFPWNL